MYSKTWLNELSMFSNQAASRIKNLSVMEENLKLVEDRGVEDRMRQLDMVASSLAHELQNPVHAIGGDIGNIIEIVNDWKIKYI